MAGHPPQAPPGGYPGQYGPGGFTQPGREYLVLMVFKVYISCILRFCSKYIKNAKKAAENTFKKKPNPLSNNVIFVIKI